MLRSVDCFYQYKIQTVIKLYFILEIHLLVTQKVINFLYFILAFSDIKKIMTHGAIKH